MSENAQELWKIKLMALLHDAPDKCFDIANHEATAKTYQIAAGFTHQEHADKLSNSVKPADWFASAAERFVFPQRKCAHNFVEDPCFIHPLSSVKYTFSDGFTAKAGAYSEAIQSAVNGVPDNNWHQKFFLYWRRWLENATAKSPDLAFLPADTRIPDHTIWTHMSLASALAPCIESKEAKPELLMMQLGPVQDFIAQARSSRDLWSGSYLISWLIAHGLKAITDEIGPDAVVFPSLRGNGIFDALHHKEFYNTPWKHGDDGKTQTTWERLLADKGDWDKMADWILTPTLPNRFFAIVPPDRSEELANKAATAIRNELCTIGEAVWQWLAANGAKEAWLGRWKSQIRAFPEITWATQKWLTRGKCLQEAEKLPQDKDDLVGVAGRLKEMLKLAEEKLPQADRDLRYYTDKESKKHLNNSGLLWSAHYALLDAKLAARRNTRNFAKWDSIDSSANVKDSLSGKEECIGDEEFWKNLTENHKKIFTASSHRYAAMNLIKRLWCHPEADISYLADKLGLKHEIFKRSVRSDSTQDIAKRNKRIGGSESSPYIAIIAMDGDEMGKWISGAKTPEFMKQLAQKANTYLSALMGTDKLQRLLTPSYHLQFSEALANFAMHKAREVVEEHCGDLLYAGGDDVLAILPSTRVIECAQKLRKAFRLDYDGCLLLPGEKCEVSCGIAVGHMNAPLQMLVKEAQEAEKRAKQEYGRAAVAINVYKRSGEIIKWGCKWESCALDLMAEVSQLSSDEKLSGRFPYALAALLQPYDLEKSDTADLVAMKSVIEKEVEHVLSRQGANLGSDKEGLANKISTWLEECWATTSVEGNVSEPRPQDFINLFLVETFMNRMRGEA
ncbi:MAG: type III-B CRISPR-associated protein Cas10/Cmr2 [Lentisphaerae bacterium]|nr:type III-B CRISPR-associated protein Cas10/Cmr2 [Lentisphaerota bacterium]